MFVKKRNKALVLVFTNLPMNIIPFEDMLIYMYQTNLGLQKGSKYIIDSHMNSSENFRKFNEFIT